MSGNTLVCLGSSPMSDYAFMAPLTALAWRDVVGFEPRVFLIGTEGGWHAEPGVRAAVRALRTHGIEHRFVSPVGNWAISTIAQNVRQHAAADPGIADDAWLMMADADLVPLRREFYQQHTGTDLRCALYYANGDHFGGKQLTLDRAARGEDYQSIPTCHVTMRARDWRAAYRYASSNIAAAMGATLAEWLGPKVRDKPDARGWLEWMSDQRIVTERVIEQPWFPEFRVDDKNADRAWRVDGVLFVTRHGHPPLDRLDRSLPTDWKQRPFLAGRWTDAHVHKAPFSDEHWGDLLCVIEAVMPQHGAWARRFREEFVT